MWKSLWVLLAAVALLGASAVSSHERPERERGHEARSERREAREERKVREQEVRREREQARALKSAERRERNATRTLEKKGSSSIEGRTSAAANTHEDSAASAVQLDAAANSSLQGSNTSGSSTSGSNISGSNSGSNSGSARLGEDAEVRSDAESSGSGSSGSDSGSVDDAMRSDSSGSGSGDDAGSTAEEEDDVQDDPRARAPLASYDVERDTQGRERVREEVLMVGAADAIASVRAAGFLILAERPLAALGEVLARVRVRPGVPLEQTMRELQAIAPQASIAPHHLFRPSAPTGVEHFLSPARVPGVLSMVQVGIVDTGADASRATLTHAILATQGFADGRYVPRLHGTLVAEIAARGGARLSVADVFGVDADHRLIAPAAAIASAIDWLVACHVRVINISIEGPNNRVLAYVIRRALDADVAIVAAAGNGGPAAEPVFPGAYPGVIAVTAVDERGQVYRRANRGDYIDFAARGVRITTQGDASGPKTLSGTSFAAPIVAAILAQRLGASSSKQVTDIVSALKYEARDLGAPGPDTIYGWGELILPEVRTANSR
jgi:minor extracellular protease Epr